MPRRLLPVRFLHRPFSAACPSVSSPPSPIPRLPAFATPTFALPISWHPPPVRSPPPVSTCPLPPYDHPSCLPDQPIPGPFSAHHRPIFAERVFTCAIIGARPSPVSPPSPVCTPRPPLVLVFKSLVV